MILHVTDAKYLQDYTIAFSFNNGEKRKVDLSMLFQYPAFSHLKDKNKFIHFGLKETIYWDNGLDVAPEFLLSNGEKCD